MNRTSGWRHRRAGHGRGARHSAVALAVTLAAGLALSGCSDEDTVDTPPPTWPDAQPPVSNLGPVLPGKQSDGFRESGSVGVTKAPAADDPLDTNLNSAP